MVADGLRPEHVLGGLLAVQQVVRTPSAVLVLRTVEVFPEGCRFDVRVVARRGDRAIPAWTELTRRLLGEGGRPEPLDFAVRLADGTAVWLWRGHPENPDGPLFIQDGSNAGADDDSFEWDGQLWLCPLPAGDLRLVASCPDLGLEATVPLEAAALARAAAQAQPYWHEPEVRA